MKSLRIAFTACFMAAALSVASTAYAQWAVIDLANLIETATSALQSLSIQANTYTAAYNSVKQTQAQLASIASNPNLSAITKVQQDLGLYSALMNNTNQLTGAITKNQTLYTNLNSQYGASGQSWQTFMSSQTANNNAQGTAMLSQVSSVNASIAALNAKRQPLLAQVQASQGPTAATQALGNQIDLLISQNNQVIQLLSAQLAKQGGDTTVKASQDSAAAQAWANYQNSLGANAKARAAAAPAINVNTSSALP